MTCAHQRPALALLHGWGVGKTAWQPLCQALAARCEVHLVDLPGYGDAPACTDSFADTAQRLVEALPAGVVLCGWSLGALLALQAARLAGPRIGGLVLVGATPSFTQRAGWPQAQPAALLETFAAAVADNPASALQRFVALSNQGDMQARAANRALWQALAAQPLPDTATLLQGLHWLRNVDLRDQIAGLAQPTLLIHGDRDPLMPLAAAQWLQGALKNAQLEVISGAAHAPFLHTPEEIAKLIGNHCHASALPQATRP